MKNEKNGIINQNLNARCQMQSLKRTLIKYTIDSFYCVWTLWYFIFKSVVWLVEGLSLKHNYKMIKKSSLKHLDRIILGIFLIFMVPMKESPCCLQWVKIMIIICMISYKQSNLHLLWIVGDSCIFIFFPSITCNINKYCFITLTNIC
jgi:hypothetical protein